MKENLTDQPVFDFQFWTTTIRYPKTWCLKQCMDYAEKNHLPLPDMFQVPMTELPWYGNINGKRYEHNNH